MLFVAIELLIIIWAFSGIALLVWHFLRKENAAGERKSSGIIAYHQILTRPILGSTWAPKSQFIRQMRMLSKKGYCSLTLEQQISAPSLKSFSIIFDDALDCLYKNALPILKELGFHATFFIITGYVGRRSRWDVYGKRHMGVDQIKDIINAGFSIGSHTVNHFDLTKLPANQLQYELEFSKNNLEDQFGVEIPLVSYPFGRFNANVIEAARKCGYRGALTIDHALKPMAHKEFYVPANVIYLFDRFADLESKITGNALYNLESLKNKLMNRFASGTILLKSGMIPAQDHSERKQI